MAFPRCGITGRGHGRNHPMDDSGKSDKSRTMSREMDRGLPPLEENSANNSACSGSPRRVQRLFSTSG